MGSLLLYRMIARVKRGKMGGMHVLLPLLCVLAYSLLSTRVLVDAGVGFSGLHGTAALSLRAYGVSLRLDGVIERAGTQLRLRMRPRYGQRTFDERTLRAGVSSYKKMGWLLHAAMGSVHWGQLDVYLRAGTDEAWSTALLAGAARSLAASLLAVSGIPCDVRVEASFDTPCFLLAARCIFSAAPGDIMFAVARAAVKKMRKEGFGWLNIPLKA